MSYLSPVLWAFLPGQITSALVPVACSVLPALFPPAPPGTSVYKRNYRLLFTAIVTLWLAYSFATREESSTESYYSVLGVEYGAGEGELRKAFRALSRKFHPDRQHGGGAGEGAEEGGDGQFVKVRHCYEVLSDSVTRFAYDRFGPATASCTTCKTARDYVHAGLQSSVGFYITALLGLLFLAVAGQARAGAYWRLTVLALLVALELSIVLAPETLTSSAAATPSAAHASSATASVASWVARLFPSQPAFITVRTLRRLATDLGVAISQLAGIWADDKVDPMALARSNVGMAREIATQSVGALNRTIGPVLASGTPEGELKEKVTDRLLDSNAVRHPGVLPWYDAKLGEHMRAVQEGMRREALAREAQ